MNIKSIEFNQSQFALQLTKQIKMGEKKKIKNKQNFVPIKRVTLQQINYTEELQIPTCNTIEIKNVNKSIELKKQNSFKKPVSRKSRCVSVKQTCASVKQSTTGSIKLKQLFKRFDELKGLQQRVQRSKSKSVKQIRQNNKSKSPISHNKVRQSNCKRLNLSSLMNKNLNKTQNVRTQFNSRMSLTSKLQRTLKKINENHYLYRDQDDSLIPFLSTSDACNNQDGYQKIYEISSQEFMDEDFINIGEMRNFCRTKENEELFETVLKKNINYFRGDQYEMMATKIQRAWRRFRTKKLVDRYADVFQLRNINKIHQSEEESEEFNLNDSFSELKYENVYRIANQLNIDLKGNAKHRESLESSEEAESDTQQDYQNQEAKNDEANMNQGISLIEAGSSNEHSNNQSLFYKNAQQNQHLVTYISNFDEEESICKSQQKPQLQPSFPQTNHLPQNTPLASQTNVDNSSCDLLISQIKQMELQKWKQVIELLEQSKKNKTPSELQTILAKLQKTSQKNKKELEDIQKDQLLSNSNKRSDPRTFEDKLVAKRQESGPSQTSDFKKQEEFDSRKYIQYLDSDMFLVNKENSSENSELINDERLGKKISKKKQKQLLAFFDIGQAPIRLRSHCFSKSQNLSYLMEDTTPYVVSVSHRLNKSISQKNIEKVIKSLSPQLQYSKEDSDTDQMNLELIRQQFLQNADPIQQLQKLHTGQELRMKIKESLTDENQNQFRDSSSDQEPIYPARISIDLSKTFDIQNQSNQSYHKISEYLHGGSLNLSKEHQNQESPQVFSLSHSNQSKNLIIIENIDKNIEDEEEQERLPQRAEQQNQKVQNVAFMIYSTMILEVLREIATYDSILEKFKDYSLSVKTQSQKQAKKGFQTNHTEVKSYVQGLINFLLNEEPQVFKNLQIPAGPTALEMLHYMHPNEYDDEMDGNSNISQDETSVMVIPNRMFDKYWLERQKSLKYDIESALHLTQQRKKKVVDELKNLTKMFYRSIFDTFNECLDIERNYGQAGKPYPWKRNASFHHTKTLSQIQKSIQTSQKRMAQIATTYCGLIIEKNEMARIAIQGSDDYIQHVQEDRMSRMLAQDLIEGEQRWTFYDDEELELLVEIGNFITISLVLEAGEEISSLINFEFQ